MSGKTCIEQHHAGASLSLWIYRSGIMLESWYVAREVQPINGSLAQSPIPICRSHLGTMAIPLAPCRKIFSTT